MENLEKPRIRIWHGDGNMYVCVLCMYILLRIVQTNSLTLAGYGDGI